MLLGVIGIPRRGYCCRSKINNMNGLCLFDMSKWKEAELFLLRDIKNNKWPLISTRHKIV